MHISDLAVLLSVGYMKPSLSQIDKTLHNTNIKQSMYAYTQRDTVHRQKLNQSVNAIDGNVLHGP